MRLRAGAAVATLLGLVLAGCGGAGTPSPSSSASTAAVRPSASCLNPEVLDALGLELDESLRTQGPTTPAARGLPPDRFVADTVLVCDRGETLRDSAGTWWSVTATRLEGDVDGLVTAVTTGVPGACGAVVPQVWLVDTMGEAVLLPRTTACPADGPVGTALAELDVVDRTEHPVALTHPPAVPDPSP